MSRTCRKHNIRGIATYGDCPRCIDEMASVPAAGSAVVTNTKRIRWAKESLLDALKKANWSAAQMYAADIAELAAKLEAGIEDERIVQPKPCTPPPTEVEKPSPYIICWGREDEMIVFHYRGAYLTTLYASCPEQSQDFVEAHGKTEFANMDDWMRLLASFKRHWRTKYPDGD